MLEWTSCRFVLYSTMDVSYTNHLSSIPGLSFTNVFWYLLLELRRGWYRHDLYGTTTVVRTIAAIEVSIPLLYIYISTYFYTM